VKKASPKPVAKKASPKPVAKKASPKPVAKKASPKPVAKKASPKPVAKKASPVETGCVKQTTKRFTARKSPPFKAENCQGKVREGNDGSKYISTQISNGSWRWYPAKKASSKPVAKKTSQNKSAVKKASPNKSVVKKPTKKSIVKKVSPISSACIKQTTKRFTARKSPPFKAENCQGKVREGNDKEKYISTQISNGSWRWVKKSVKPSKKSVEPKKSVKPPARKMYTSSKGTYYIKYENGKTTRVYVNTKSSPVVKKVSFKSPETTSSETTSSDSSCSV
jgi:hypothetical protein